MTKSSHSSVRHGTRGFTLLEVMIAVGILSVTLTSLLTSQMNSIRATQYSRSVTAAAFLAEHQIIEIETRMRRDGWGKEDREFEGNFSDQGWANIRYKCLVDFLQLPDYSAIQRAQDKTEEGMTGVNTYTLGEQAMDAMGMVWHVIKHAIEQSIRKANCIVYWSDGSLQHEFQVSTYWTDPEKLQQLPQFGGESTDEDGKSGAPNAPKGAAPGSGPAKGGPAAPGVSGMGK